MGMPDRKYDNGSEYRYGFNGKEKDKDISEGGQDYGMRIYDARLGRFLSVDPITSDYPYLTPFQFASNRPIDGIDLDGLEWSVEESTATPEQGGKTTVIYTIKISLSDTRNQLKLSSEDSKSVLDEIKSGAETILSNPNASGSKSDPIVKVNIIFSDDEGSFKLIAREYIAYSGMNSKTGVIESSGDPINQAGTTEKMGESQSNNITIALSHRFILKSGNLVLSDRKLNDAPTKTLGRTLAHELGHSIGLKHTWALDNELKDVDERNAKTAEEEQVILDNLMNSEGGSKDRKLASNDGKKLTTSQREVMKSTVEKQQKKNDN